MKPCRECQHQVSEQAFACPQCGAPYPSREVWDGWGYEYKSKITIAGLPLIHVECSADAPSLVERNSCNHLHRHWSTSAQRGAQALDDQ